VIAAAGARSSGTPSTRFQRTQQRQVKEISMNRVSFTSRLGAALAALGTTAGIVWAMSAYAYPGAPEFQAPPMAGAARSGTCS
jgi:hypothetical protein